MRKTLTAAVERSKSLGPVVQRGVEAGCAACHKPISAHVKRGRWIGCQARALPTNVPFILVPLRRKLDSVIYRTAQITLPAGVTTDRRAGLTVEETGRTTFPPRSTPAVAADKPTAAPRSFIMGPRFVFRVRDKRVKLPEDSPKALLDTYKGLLKATKPVTANEAAKLAKHPAPANRQRLAYLVKKKLVIREAAPAA